MAKFKNRKAAPSFSRPVSVGSSQAIREWRNVEVRSLAEGDIIAGKGRIDTIYQTCDSTYYIVAGEATEDFFEPNQIMFAFVRKDN